MINKVFGKVIIPLMYYGKGDNRFFYLKFYKNNLKKTNAEIKEYQLQRLKALINHAYNTVPYYKTLFDANNIKPEDIQSLNDLKKIPILEKRAILSNLNELKSSKKYKLLKDSSGGSTGNKVTVYKDKRYHAISKAVLMRDLSTIGVNPGHKSVWISGNIYRNYPNFSKLFFSLFDRLNRKLVLDTFQYKEDDVEKWFKTKYNKFKPDYVFGFGGALYDIAKLIKDRNIKIHKPKKVISSSERLEHRAFIESVFGCKVIDQYGSTEIPAIAMEDNNYVMHSSDDFVIVELTEENEIILTPLESYGMPLIRYKIGDIGFRNKKQKSDDSPFSQFNIFIGRTYEVMKNNKGEHISGGLIKTQVEDENLDINEFQIVQKSLDEVDINIIKDELTSENGVKRLKEIIVEHLGCTKININYLKKFPTEPNGKRIAFKCLI
jgi:phenylacetate-CoA ligase